MSVEFRPVTTEDEPFLFELYSATRIEELAAWGWDQSQWEPFLRMQFAAQQQHYRTQFPDADHLILVLDQRPIGRTVVSRRIQEVRLVDIALLPEHRNAGTGTRFLEDLQAEANDVHDRFKAFQLASAGTTQRIRSRKPRFILMYQALLPEII